MADTITDNEPVSGLNEPSYDVQVTLADLQDTDNPLATAKDFKDLNLLVVYLVPSSEEHINEISPLIELWSLDLY